MKLTIGADPELFLRKDGQFFSAHGMIPGTKMAPHPVDKGAVQVDGLALEFNINPAETFEEFNVNINTVLAQLRSMVPPDYEFVFSSSAEFSKEHMEAQLPEALEIGCQPDYDAYTLTLNPTPEFGKTDRAAGGHIHIGWGEGFDVDDPIHIRSCARLAKQMDFYVGIPSLVLDPDTKRRESYGKPGAFRPKPYGMEYRSLSNFWVNKENYRKFIFDQTKKAFEGIINHQDVTDSINPRYWWKRKPTYVMDRMINYQPYKAYFEGMPV